MAYDGSVALGYDPNASGLMDVVKAHLDDLGIAWEDYGGDDPIYANAAIRGILMCGTGLGMSLAANKVPGAFAVTCTDPYSTERSIKSNNANILTMGAQVVGPELAKSLVKVWMDSEYEPGGRSEPKIQRIYEYEREHMRADP